MATTIFNSLIIVSSSGIPFTMSLVGLRSASLHAPILFYNGNIAQTASSAIPEFSPGIADFAVTYVNGNTFTSTKDIKRNIADNSIIIASQSNFVLDVDGTYLSDPANTTKIGAYIGSIITGGGSSSIIYSNGDVGELPLQGTRYYVYINDESDDNVWGETYALTHGNSVIYDIGLDTNTITLTSSALPFTGVNSSVVKFFFVKDSDSSVIEGIDETRFNPFYGSLRLTSPSDPVKTSTALNKYTTTFGSKNNALGPYTAVYGSLNTVVHVASFVAGTGNVNTNNGKYGQFVCGKSVKTDLRFPTASDADSFGYEKFIVGAGGLNDYTGTVNNDERFLNFEIILHANQSSSMVIPYTFNNTPIGGNAFIPNPKTGSMFFHLKANRLLIYNGTTWVSHSFF